VLSELWSFGCVLYALCTHRPAFADPDDVKLLGKVQKGEYVLAEKVRPDISPELAAIISGLLTVDPTRRTQTAAHALKQLEGLLRVREESKPVWSPAALTVQPQPGTDTSIRTANLKEKKSPSLSGFSVNLSDPSAESLSKPTTEADDLPSLSSVSRVPPPSTTPELAQAAASTSAKTSPHAKGGFIEVGSLLVPGPTTNNVTPSKKESPPSAIDISSASEVFGGQKPAAPAAARAENPQNDLSVFSAALAGERAPSRLAAPMPQASPATTQDQDTPSLADISDPPTPSVTSMPAPRFTAPAAATPSTKGKAFRNLLIPAAGAATVFLVGAIVVTWSNEAIEKTTTPTFVDPDAASKRTAQTELADLEREKKDATERDKERQRLIAAAFAATPPPTSPPTPEGTSPPAPTEQPTDSDRPPTATAKVKPRALGAGPKEPPESPKDEWAARYGSRASFNQSAVAGTDTAATTATTASPTGGVRIQARLDGALASSPTGPAIAITTAPAKVGDLVIPAGTQIHGTTQGTSGARILARFEFAIVGGKNVPLRATALGQDGRAGIPGTRSLGGVSDIGAGGAGGTVSGVTSEAASALGPGILSSAASGAGNALSGKTGKLNNEEEVVTTKKGARLVIYIESK
jgi:hypothetical protein